MVSVACVVLAADSRFANGLKSWDGTKIIKPMPDKLPNFIAGFAGHAAVMNEFITNMKACMQNESLSSN